MTRVCWALGIPTTTTRWVSHAAATAATAEVFVFQATNLVVDPNSETWYWELLRLKSWKKLQTLNWCVSFVSRKIHVRDVIETEQMFMHGISVRMLLSHSVMSCPIPFEEVCEGGARRGRIALAFLCLTHCFLFLFEVDGDGHSWWRRRVGQTDRGPVRQLSMHVHPPPAPSMRPVRRWIMFWFGSDSVIPVWSTLWISES